MEVNWEFAYASTYRIQTSIDGTTFTTAATETTGFPGLRVTTFPARSARYIRVVGDVRATAYGISFWDVRAFGPAAPPPPDTDPPETTISSGPTGSSTSTSASFAFASDETGSTFECRLDGGAWAACSSPKAYSSLVTGPHTFEVRATDSAGNVDASPATRSWTIDAPAASGDLALNRPASASSTDPSAGAPGAANDGDSATRWSSAFADNQWWQVDLGAVKSIDRVEVNWEAAYASAYRIQTSTDGTTFTTAASVTRSGAGLEVTSFAERTARYVRLVADARGTPYGISFWDFRRARDRDRAAGHRSARHGDQLRSERHHQRDVGELRVHRDGGRFDLRVPHRRGRVRSLQLAEGLQLARRDLPYVRRAGNRPGRERRPHSRHP